MLRDFRAWLQSELQLLGNASHHAYAFGQANMAKRALERYDAETAELAAILATLVQNESLPPPVLEVLKSMAPR